MIKTLRHIRAILFKSWLITIAAVIVMWAFYMMNLVEFFMWGFPGFSVHDANNFIMWLIGIIDILGLVFFLIPTIALSWHIHSYKKTEDYQIDKIYDDMEKETFGEFAFGKPGMTTKAPAAKKPVVKKPANKKARPKKASRRK